MPNALDDRRLSLAHELEKHLEASLDYADKLDFPLIGIWLQTALNELDHSVRANPAVEL